MVASRIVRVLPPPSLKESELPSMLTVTSTRSTPVAGHSAYTAGKCCNAT
jgi:hypothetical protein